jgi:uncharacterized protein YyaL (SSP411 family)
VAQVITAWNGLMLSAFAKAAQAVPSGDRREQYLQVATRAANFLHDNLYSAEVSANAK